MFYNKAASRVLVTKYGTIKRVPYFRYLGETIQESGLQKVANEIRCQKMETALRLPKNICNKKCLSKNTKIRNCNTVMKPECFYGAETLIMIRKSDIENIQKMERKIIRKILDPEYSDEGTYKLRANSVIKNYSDIHSDMKKRWLKFHGHIKRME